MDDPLRSVSETASSRNCEPPRLRIDWRIPPIRSVAQLGVVVWRRRCRRIGLARGDVVLRSLRADERRGVRAVAELFDLYSRQPQIVRICGARGSGKTTTAVQLARVARMQGYIPFSARLLDTLFVEALEGRSALIIDDDATGANGLLDVALRSPRRHILLTTSREATHGPSAITLRGLPPATLAAAVLPTAMADAPRVRQAAIRANGVPGAFLELLHGTRVERLRRKPTASRAAEQTPAYGSEDAASPVYGRTAISAVRTTWPAPGELAALRRQMDTALVLLGAGRHAPGDRALRQAIGGMAR